MRKRWKACVCVMFLAAVGSIPSAEAGIWYIKVFNLAEPGNREIIISRQKPLTLRRNEIAWLKFVSQYSKPDEQPYIAEFQQYIDRPGYTIDTTYIKGWKDQRRVVTDPGRFENTVLIRPTSNTPVGIDSFMIDMRLRYGLSPYDNLEALRLLVVLNIVDSQVDPPVIIPEPRYTPGTTNTIFYYPSRDAALTLQDVYCFDTTDSLNLKKSLRRLYRAGNGDSLPAVFEGLEEGRNYGFFAKAMFVSGTDTFSLYSDFTYSIQDRTPPERVVEPKAVLDADGNVRVSWKQAQDATSGVAEYRIYRAEDTGPEIPIEKTVYTAGEYLYFYDRLRAGVTSYYRIRAVDGVGNEGDGERTLGLPSGAPSPADQVDNSGSGSTPQVRPAIPFIRGFMDTVRYTLKGFEDRIQFIAARDDTSYFQNPPPAGGRLFRSRIFSVEELRQQSTSFSEVSFVFDYTDGGQVPVHFVNGHVYFWRVLAYYHNTSVVADSGRVMSDCFDPEDIRNLKVESIIDDPNSQDPTAGYSRWHFKITWETSTDGASGLRRYWLYRKIDGVDSFFQEIPLPDRSSVTEFSDRLYDLPRHAARNPFVRYRVGVEDYAGNLRSGMESAWEASERALGGPLFSFADTTSSTVRLSRPGSDTLFTKRRVVVFRLDRFDIPTADRVVISLNGEEAGILPFGRDSIRVTLPEEELTRIRVRAMYPADRSSIWSNEKVVIQASLDPVEKPDVWNDTTGWAGDIYLRWKKPALDVKQYEVVRWSVAETPRVVGTVVSMRDTVFWKDPYESPEPDEPLTAYRMYHYAVRKINVFLNPTRLSESDSAYCNKPPTMTAHRIRNENGTFCAQVFWKRPNPTDVQSDFTTYVRIYRDSLSNLLFKDINGDDDLDYTLCGIQPGHNYIFRIQEAPNRDPSARRTPWSQPHTVSFKALALGVQAQPKGTIDVHWDTGLVDSFSVDAFQVHRIQPQDTFTVSLPNTASSYWDSSASLVHGRSYLYQVFALDSLGQVVAANVRTAVCDTGSAYIPFIDPVTVRYRYLRLRSVDVHWTWKDVNGARADSTTRGARFVKIETSVSRTFPPDSQLTCTPGWISADALVRWIRVCIPSLTNAVNDSLFFRVTAEDSLGNNHEPLFWSDRFDSIRFMLWDEVSPVAVDSVEFTSVKAHFAGPDSVVREIRWIGKPSENVPEEPDSKRRLLIQNVCRYELWRLPDSGGDSVQVGESSVNHLVDAYSVVDGCRNARARYKIVTFDSAGNSSSGRWNGLQAFLETPAAPVPTGKQCCRISGKPTGAEVFVEIAMLNQHFRMAETLPDDSLLARSGWIQDSLFCDGTGWGEIEADTTWFRVKARKTIGGLVVESGWSYMAPWSALSPTRPGENQSAGESEIPQSFELLQNYPNPFNAGTAVPYRLPERAHVRISIFNIRGGLVRVLMDEMQAAGARETVWDGTDDRGLTAASGIYIAFVAVRLESGETFQKRIKMVMIR